MQLTPTMARLVCLAVLIAAAGCVPRVKAPPRWAKRDSFVGLRRTIHFKLTDDKQPVLTARVAQHIQYLSPQSTRLPEQLVVEHYFAPVNNLLATKNGFPLPAQVVESTTPELENIFLSDLRVHRIRYGGIERGDSVGYSYAQRYIAPAYLPLIYLPNIDQVDLFEVRFDHPPGVQIKLSFHYPHGQLKPVIRRSSTTTLVRFQNVPFKEPSPYFAFNDSRAVIRAEIKRGDRSLTPATPSDFSRWYEGLLPARKQRALTAKQRASLQTLVKGAATPEKKLRLLYDHVRQSIHYVADERHRSSIVPRPPSVVLRRRYGDCKDKALLLAELARELGIEVDLVLVATRPSPPIDSVHIALFDHVIASYRRADGTRLYLDATSPYVQYGNLPESDIGRPALILAGEQSKRVSIPSPKVAPDAAALEVSISASAQDLVSAKAEVILRGELRVAEEVLARQTRGQPYQLALSRLIGKRLRGVLLSRFELRERKPNAVRFSARADVSSLVNNVDRRLFVSTTPFDLVDGTIALRRADSRPIHVGRRADAKLVLTLSGAPDLATDASWQWSDEMLGNYSAEVQPSQDGSLRFVYRVHQRLKTFAAQPRARMLRFWLDYLGKRKQLHVATTGGPS